jgi:hypothetical protein
MRVISGILEVPNTSPKAFGLSASRVLLMLLCDAFKAE